MSVHFTLSDLDPEIHAHKKATGDSQFKPFPSSFLSKKRKVEDLYDINNPASNLLIAADTLIEEYTDRVKTVDVLNSILKKNSLELEEAKQKIKTLEVMLAKKPDHTLLEEFKRDAVIAVLESKIHMATEAAENGLDSSLWDVNKWKRKLEKLKDEYTTIPSFRSHQGYKAPKKTSSTVSKTKIIGETSRSRNENIGTAEDPIVEEESSGEDGI